MAWKVVAYHTKDLIYSDYARKLKSSLDSLELPYEIVAIDSIGDWYKNMQYKPMFVRDMVEKHKCSIVYVDADAIFCRYPKFFDQLDQRDDVNIAVHLLDHSKYRRKGHPSELLSGTIFFKYTDEASIIINDWIDECSRDSRLWDQVALSRVLKNHKFHFLPEEYCMIFDYMESVKNPVIKHFQASRQVRRRSMAIRREGASNQTSSQTSLGELTLQVRSKPRVVKKNGVVRIRRAGLL